MTAIADAQFASLDAKSRISRFITLLSRKMLCTQRTAVEALCWWWMTESQSHWKSKSIHSVALQEERNGLLRRGPLQPFNAEPRRAIPIDLMEKFAIILLRIYECHKTDIVFIAVERRGAQRTASAIILISANDTIKS